MTEIIKTRIAAGAAGGGGAPAVEAYTKAQSDARFVNNNVIADIIGISANETYKMISSGGSMIVIGTIGGPYFIKPRQTAVYSFSSSANIPSQYLCVCANRNIANNDRLRVSSSGTTITVALSDVGIEDNGLKFYVCDTRYPEVKSDIVMVSVNTGTKTSLSMSADYDSDGNVLVTGLFAINLGGIRNTLNITLNMYIDGERQSRVYTSEQIQKDGNTYIYSRFSVPSEAVASIGDKTITFVVTSNGLNYTKDFTKEEIGL